MKKAGLSMTSMVIYVALFFAFSAFAVAISTNYNYQTLNEKGCMWVNEQFDKLQYNLLKSAKQSERVSIIADKIVFSNNDEYVYDSENKRVLKNGGVIAMDVESFSIIDNTSVIGGNNFYSNLDKELTNLAIDITLKKYGNEKVSQIFMTAGGVYNEDI